MLNKKEIEKSKERLSKKLENEKVLGMLAHIDKIVDENILDNIAIETLLQYINQLEQEKQKLIEELEKRRDNHKENFELAVKLKDEHAKNIFNGKTIEAALDLYSKIKAIPEKEQRIIWNFRGATLISREEAILKKEIKEYLDKCIIFWRKKRDDEMSEIAKYYIDAFQSVRTSLLNELLI